MKKLILIVLICLVSIPVTLFSIVLFGVYFKKHTGYLTKDIYLTIGSSPIISMQALSCNMPNLPVISTQSKISVLNKGKLILGYNPSISNYGYDYYFGYFIIDSDKGVTNLSLSLKEYEKILENKNITRPIKYALGYQYINIPAYKTKVPVIQNCSDIL